MRPGLAIITKKFNDATHARACFERRVKPNVRRCVYICPFRPYPSNFFQAYVIAYEYGTWSSSAGVVLPLIHRAALSSARVRVGLRLGGFARVTVPLQFLAPLFSPH